MSVKRFVQAKRVTGVQVGKTATLDLPIGPRYHTIRLTASDTAGETVTSIIDEMRLKINGKVERTMTADDLNQLNLLMGSIYGLHAAGTAAIGNNGYAEILPIFFAEPWRKDLTAQDGLAWNTGNLSTFQLEIDVKAAAAGASLSALAEVDTSIITSGTSAGQPNPIGKITLWEKLQIPVNGSPSECGQNFKDLSGYLQQISFFDSNITKVEIKVNDFLIREATKQENDSILVERGMSPVSGRFDVVFDHDDVLDSALPLTNSGGVTISDVSVRLTLSDSTPRNIETIIHRFDAPV